MDSKTVFRCYYMLTVYRILDIVCDLCCCYHLENSSDKETQMLFACIFSTGFNLWYLYRAKLTCHKLLPQDIGRIDSRRIILPELHFNMFEPMINFLQSVVDKEITPQREVGCVNSMYFDFACFCCFGSVLQILCFLKNVCGYHGETKQNECNKIMNIVGLAASFVSLCAFLPFFEKELRFCWCTWTVRASAGLVVSDKRAMNPVLHCKTLYNFDNSKPY